jgi:hypothetical protein
VANQGKSDDLESKGKANRRSTRVSLAIPIVMTGKDASGKPFRENTRTILVNKQGAKIATRNQMALASEVSIENLSLGRTAKATIVWVGDRKNPAEPIEIGAQLRTAENIWGIIFPPEDWDDGPPVGAGGIKLDRSTILPPVTSSEPAVPPPVPAPAQSPTVPAQVVPSSLAGTPLSQDHINVAAAAAFRKLVKDLDDVVESRMKAYNEKMIRFTNQFGLSAQASLQEAANRTEDRMVGLMEQKLGGLADRVQSSRSAFENLMVRFEHLHQNTESQLQNTEQKIREASQAALQSALQEMTDSFRKQVETSAAALESQSKKRIEDGAAEAFESARKKTDEQVKALVDEGLRKSAEHLKVQQSVAAGEAKQQLEQSNLAAQSILQEKLDEMVEAMAASSRNAMAATVAAAEAQFTERIQKKGSETLKPLIEDADEHLTILLEDCFRKSASGLKEQETKSINGVKEQLDEITKGAGTAVQEKIESMAGELSPSIRQEMGKSLEASAGAVIDQAKRSLQELTQLLSQDALLALQQSVQALQDRIQEENLKVRHACQEATASAAQAVDQNITQRVEAGIGSMNLAVEQGAARIRAAQTDAESALKPRLQNFEEQLTTRTAFALESFHTALQSNARQFQEGAGRQFSQKLQGVADEWTEIAAEKIRRRIQSESVNAAETFSKDSTLRLAALANEIYARSSQEFKVRLNEQAKLQLDQTILPVTAEFGETLKKMSREVALSLEADSRSGLQKAAQELLRASAENFQRESEQITGRVLGEIQASETALDDRVQKRLETLSASAVERISRDANSWLEEYRAQVRKSELASQEASLRELDATFQAAMEKQRASFGSLLEQQADQARLQAALHIKSETEQVVSRATDTLDKQVGRGSRVLAELGDQARAGLDNQVQKIEMEAKAAIWNFQKQVDQASGASIEQFRREMGTLVDEVVSRLHQSVRSFQGATSDELRSELQKASDNLLEVSSAQMRKQTEEALQLITEQLKRKEEEVASEATDIFRDRIAGIFAILQPSPRKPSPQELVEPEKMKDPG